MLFQPLSIQRKINDTHWNCYIHCIYLSLNTLGHQGAGLIFYWIRNNNFNFSLTLLDEHLDELNECFYEHSYEHLYEHSYMSIHKNIHINIHSAPTMVCICGKSSNSDFLGQTGQKRCWYFLWNLTLYVPLMGLLTHNATARISYETALDGCSTCKWKFMIFAWKTII